MLFGIVAYALMLFSWTTFVETAVFMLPENCSRCCLLFTVLMASSQHVSANFPLLTRYFLLFNPSSTEGDNSNKRCFGTKPKLFRESGDFSGNRDTWKFFRETRDNSGTLQECRNFSGHVSQQFGRMIQISGTT